MSHAHSLRSTASGRTTPAALSRRALLGSLGAAGLAATFTAFAPTAAQAATSTKRLTFGVANPGGPLDSSYLSSLTSLVGEAPRLLEFYKDFRQPAPVSEISAALNAGARPVITWEPWAADGGLTQPGYSMASIAAGAFDGYLNSWASALAPYGDSVSIRFAHEMNGNWYPWCPGVNGTTAADYVAAWRHVWAVLAAGGATPRWIWSVNDPYPGSVPLDQVYPGNDVVTELALDSYNFGTSQSWSTWKTPSQVFAPGLSALRALGTGKSILVSETASSELGGSKPNWIRDGIAYLDAQADVSGFIWFDFLKETDWRINSSTASSTAFRKALASRSTV
ncbi:MULTISPECIES: glycosyl hydrolase [Arthrobacter]|uniref:Glycosyl hydrolase n=2 Tax=Arthrobacter TaxID=1663 RepID=A0ABU9KLU3_9MICC|nr:glycosyl hydrolase [Arthrobacter sp. YJM1]MDP5228197.1 glycosyl hydrolase [Arthrobacter sp. YJM1]